MPTRFAAVIGWYELVDAAPQARLWGCQAIIDAEKAERARVVATLRDSIAAMKQAGQTEAELRQEVAHLESQLADAKIARQHQKSQLQQQRSEAEQLRADLQDAQVYHPEWCLTCLT